MVVLGVLEELEDKLLREKGGTEHLSSCSGSRLKIVGSLDQVGGVAEMPGWWRHDASGSEVTGDE